MRMHVVSDRIKQAKRISFAKLRTDKICKFQKLLWAIVIRRFFDIMNFRKNLSLPSYNRLLLQRADVFIKDEAVWWC